MTQKETNIEILLAYFTGMYILNLLDSADQIDSDINYIIDKCENGFKNLVKETGSSEKAKEEILNHVGDILNLVADLIFEWGGNQTNNNILMKGINNG